MGKTEGDDNHGAEAARLLRHVIDAAVVPDGEVEKFRKTQREQILKRVSSLAEVVTDPESPELVDFVASLHRQFKPGEVENLKVFQDELRGNGKPDSKAHYICVVLRDPLNNEVASGAYGSVDNFGTLALRFTLTEASYLGEPPDPRADERDFKGFRGYRGTGVSQVADNLLMDKAVKLSGDKGLNAIVGEAVSRSEAYWNKFEIEAGNGMRRLYIQKPDGAEEEFKYRLPPLSWNSDGTPASEEIEEHLQVAVRGCKNQISVNTLKEIVRHWWETWYIRGEEQFDNKEAWQKHIDTVWAIFEDLFRPVADVENLVLRTRNEREFK
ncbi:hypothetical protein HZC21_03525 [Candidatus Peregrinibacteria bacterium]|nr:hypothetical protein [Candidatus Peregrinibacteria bacterium]